MAFYLLPSPISSVTARVLASLVGAQLTHTRVVRGRWRPRRDGQIGNRCTCGLCCFVFQVGTAAEIRQPASGMSHDWAKARAGIKFSYHVDLRDSFGPYGFLLPGSQIVSTARETWQAVKAIVDNLSVA